VEAELEVLAAVIGEVARAENTTRQAAEGCVIRDRRRTVTWTIQASLTKGAAEWRESESSRPETLDAVSNPTVPALSRSL